MTTDEFTPTLNELMEFDHVIVVHEDGTITDAPNERKYWEPELLDDELSDPSKWEFFTTGYSGQDSYSGPIMHNSEFIGGTLERDLRSTPGVYVALVSYYSENAEGHYESDNDGLYAEGWAIARLKDEFTKEITQ